MNPTTEAFLWGIFVGINGGVLVVGMLVAARRGDLARALKREWEHGYEWRCAEERGEVVNVSDYLPAGLANDGAERMERP